MEVLNCGKIFKVSNWGVDQSSARTHRPPTPTSRNHKAMIRPILKFANHPLVLTFSGIFLAISGLIELGESVVTLEGGVKGEHGILV